MRARGCPGLASYERGTLLIVVLFLLLVTSILGLSAIRASGLEMQMSSNNRDQLLTYEATEYAVAQVASDIQAKGGFSGNSISNFNCGSVCFDQDCTGGYCFFGAALGDPQSWKSCAVGLPALDPSMDAALWATGSGRHNLLVIPGSAMSARYIVEFRCYAALDDSVAVDDVNNTPLYRITALVTDEGGRAGAMLRVMVKNQ